MNSRPDEFIAIADDFYLIALDERTGRPRLNAKAMSLGLSAALLCELVLADHIGVKSNRIELAARRPPLEDPVLLRMLDHIVAEPNHPVPVWLAFFAQTAAEAVGERLVGRGYMRSETSRGLLRSKESHVPTDLVALAWRSLRIAQVIAKRDVRTWEDLTLVGLLSATGLAALVLWNADPGDQENLRNIVGGLTEEASLLTLITQVEALIAAAVLAQRK